MLQRNAGTYRKIQKDEVATVVRMAWPSIMESFFVALAGMVDTMMVSSIGPEAVAAVGLTTQPKFIGLALFIASNVAISSIIARRRGEERRDSANQTLMLALSFTVLMSLVIGFLCVSLADPLMKLCGSKPETHDLAVEYFRIIMGCMIFNVITMVINAAQRGSGNTKIAMRTNVVSNCCNIVFNYLLIGGHLGFPKMGVRGAAIATVLGTVVACVMSIQSLFVKGSFVSIPYCVRNRLKFTLEPLGIMAKLGSSVLIEQVLLRIGFLATALMAADMGTADMAAHQIGMNALSLSFSFGDGLQSAAVALIGQSLGRKDPSQAKQYGHICQRVGNVISILLSLFFFFGGRAFYGLFFEDQAIIQTGVTIMRIIVVIVLFQVPQVVYTGCLRGAGDVFFTMIASTISVTFVRSIVSWVMCYPLGLGIAGIWFGIVADQGCRLLFSSYRFASEKWMKIVV
ncbi:MAG: MATE family efflux transporter [Fusicatenibacter sp.]|nr:MATE family efflux transporter [Fusicatenibacter sp.]